MWIFSRFNDIRVFCNLIYKGVIMGHLVNHKSIENYSELVTIVFIVIAAKL